MGRINIELPDDLHKKARLYALQNDMTLISLVRKSLEDLLKKRY